jgi:hypothetical protein
VIYIDRLGRETRIPFLKEDHARAFASGCETTGMKIKAVYPENPLEVHHEHDHN